MTADPIDRTGLSPRFWERKPLTKMNEQEWEALCDGCGKCCHARVWDGEKAHYTGEVCRFLKDNRCSVYPIRKFAFPACVQITPENIADIAWSLPETCAYRRKHEDSL